MSKAYVYPAGLLIYCGRWTIFVFGLEIFSKSSIPKIKKKIKIVENIVIVETIL